mmetsp:Transcript_10658/g.19674  ORF Transcript_10658/g.19674 Transcript_10658/m.19674 type:complete len:120 (-) Transcript_10658:278-637(-)
MTSAKNEVKRCIAARPLTHMRRDQNQENIILAQEFLFPHTQHKLGPWEKGVTRFCLKTCKNISEERVRLKIIYPIRDDKIRILETMVHTISCQREGERQIERLEEENKKTSMANRGGDT